MSTNADQSKMTIDTALITAIRNGDADVTNEQLSGLRPLLVRIAKAILDDPSTAEDMAQAALVKFVSYVRDVDTEIHNPLGLATTIVRNLSIGLLRKRSRRRRPYSLANLLLENGSPIELAAETSMPDELLTHQERIQRLREAVQRLKPKQQAVLQGLYWEGQTQEDVAKTLRITVRSVYNLREKALSRLMEYLNEG